MHRRGGDSRGRRERRYSSGSSSRGTGSSGSSDGAETSFSSGDDSDSGSSSVSSVSDSADEPSFRSDRRRGDTGGGRASRSADHGTRRGNSRGRDHSRPRRRSSRDSGRAPRAAGAPRRVKSADGDESGRYRQHHRNSGGGGGAASSSPGRREHAAPVRTHSMPVATGVTRRVSGLWRSVPAAAAAATRHATAGAQGVQAQSPAADPATLSEDEELAAFSRGLGGYGKNIARRHDSVFNTLRAKTLRARAAAAAIAHINSGGSAGSASSQRPEASSRGSGRGSSAAGTPAALGASVHGPSRHSSNSSPSPHRQLLPDEEAAAAVSSSKQALEPLIIMESHLKKRARKKGALDLFPSWKERYFVLSQNLRGQYDLKYYDDVVETSSGVVPVKEHACIALEYVDSVWIPLHQPQNQKCRTFCLTYTTYGSRKYRQRHILDPSSYLPPSPDAEEEELDVNPGLTTLFLQSETSRLCHRWVIALNRALKDMREPQKPKGDGPTRTASPQKKHKKPKNAESLRRQRRREVEEAGAAAEERARVSVSPRRSSAKEKKRQPRPRKSTPATNGKAKSPRQESKQKGQLDASVYDLDAFLRAGADRSSSSSSSSSDGGGGGGGDETKPEKKPEKKKENPDEAGASPSVDSQAALEIAEAEAVEEAAAAATAPEPGAGGQPMRASPGDDIARVATVAAEGWEAPAESEPPLSLGQRLLRQDLVQKHVAEVSAKVVAFIESDAGRAFVLAEAGRLQAKRRKQKRQTNKQNQKQQQQHQQRRGGGADSDSSGSGPSDDTSTSGGAGGGGGAAGEVVHPKYIRFVQKRMLKLARAKARSQAAAQFKQQQQQQQQQQRVAMVGGGGGGRRSPNNPGSAREFGGGSVPHNPHATPGFRSPPDLGGGGGGRPPPSSRGYAQVGVSPVKTPQYHRDRGGAGNGASHRDRHQQWHHNDHGRHRDHERDQVGAWPSQPSQRSGGGGGGGGDWGLDPREAYALYTNSPPSSVISAGGARGGRAPWYSPPAATPSRRDLGMSADEEHRLRTYVQGLVSRGLDSGVFMEPHHAQDYARDRFQRVLRGERWDCWFRDVTHDALVQRGFRLRVPVCYGRVRMLVPPVPPQLLSVTAVNNIIDTIRCAKDILVAAGELGVRVPSHADLRARVEARMQTRISGAWTPWLVQLLRAVE